MRAIIVFGIAITVITAFCRRDLVYPDAQMGMTAIVWVDIPVSNLLLYRLVITDIYWPNTAGAEK